MIKLKSILREAGLLKEQGDQSYEPVKFNFESGKYKLPTAEQQKIDRVVSQVKSMIDNGYEITNITIESGESKVPSSQFKEGLLSKLRGEAVKKQLESALPNQTIIVQTTIGDTAYTQGVDDPGDDKYKKEQFVRAVINTNPSIIPGEPERYLVVQPRPGSNGEYYNIVIPSDGYPNAVDYMVSDVAQQFITTHPHRTKIDKNTLLQFLRENGNGRIRVNLVAYPLYTVIVTDYNKSLPSQGRALHRWVRSNKLQQKPGANLF